MHDLVAQVCVRVIIPFSAPGGTEEERAALSVYAEEKLTVFVSERLGRAGQVVNAWVEEVRDADQIPVKAEGPPAAPPVAEAQQAAVIGVFDVPPEPPKEVPPVEEAPIDQAPVEGGGK